MQRIVKAFRVGCKDLGNRCPEPLGRCLISDVRELEIACQDDSGVQYQMVDIVTLVVPLISEASQEAIKLLTGKLLTESQIQSVSKHVVGKYFANLLPTSENEAEAEERIASARMHITEASNIISSLQDNLERQSDQLEFLAKEIDQKKQIAERYAVLAQTNQDVFSAFKTEMEETLRKELNAQNEKGKTIRRTVSFASWLVALVAGAFLGAWFQIQLEPKVPSPKNQRNFSITAGKDRSQGLRKEAKSGLTEI